jgi:lactate dehydrogenase-like 2-hydroxyacid dehydrogenase
MMHDLLQIGTFPRLAQDIIDNEFRCHSLEAIERDEALRASVRGIITRSNCVVPAAVIESLPNLGIIATCGVGYDLIPIDVAARRNVVVSNTPDVLNDAVAELCVGLLFALLRRIPEGDRFTRSGAWRTGAFPLGVSLAGTTQLPNGGRRSASRCRTSAAPTSGSMCASSRTCTSWRATATS